MTLLLILVFAFVGGFLAGKIVGETNTVSDMGEKIIDAQKARPEARR